MDHTDDDLLVSIVEHGQFSSHLQPNVREQVRVSLRKHIFALTKLHEPTDDLPLLVHPYTAYINVNAILHDPQIHSHFPSCRQPLPVIVIRASGRLEGWMCISCATNAGFFFAENEVKIE